MEAWTFAYNNGKVDYSELQRTAMKVKGKVNDNGNSYDAYFYAGGIVNTYQQDTNSISPSFDFALFKVPFGTVKDTIDWTKPGG